jgi:hypothetical protein
MMNNLRTELEESYDLHPAFGLGRPVELNHGDLENFTEAYGYLADFGARMSSQCYAESARLCANQLEVAWKPLIEQAADENERLFFTELIAEVRRLLAEEISCFRVRLTAKGIGFAAEGAKGDALRLHRERHFFGSLPPAAVAEILSLGSAHLDRFRAAAAAGRFKRDDLTLSQGNEIRGIMAILNAQFARSGVLDALAAYSGQRVWVNGLAMELSVPHSRWWDSALPNLPRAPQTVYAHLDEAIANPKAIVYLSDVTNGHGPTSCYPGAFDDLALNPLQALVGRVVGNVGNRVDSPLSSYYQKSYHQSMTSERFRQHFLRLPRALRFNSHFGWDVLPGSRAESSLAARERFMIGRAGTYLVFDGARLLHRGGMPHVGERIALQVLFASTGVLRRVARNIRSILK